MLIIINEMKARIEDYGGNWLPDYLAETVLDIDFQYLKQKGIKSVMFDLDHTILTHGAVDVDKSIIETLKNSGMDIYIATNRRKSSALDGIKTMIGAKEIMFARSFTVAKPSKKYYELAVEMTERDSKEVAMVGDRLVQDIYGANRAGLMTIMVRKFGHIKWYDQILTISDRVVPILFKKHYRSIEE